MRTFELVEALIARDVSICTAESCTSGLVCAELTSVSGSSQVVAGGVVVYQTPMKGHILGLKEVTEDNVVSRDVANYMAIEVVKKFGTDASVATTGYLEPYNGHDPVAYVSLLWPGSPPTCERVELSSDRSRSSNRNRVVTHAIQMLAAKLM